MIVSAVRINMISPFSLCQAVVLDSKQQHHTYCEGGK